MPRVGLIGNRCVPARGDRPHLQLSTQSAEIRNLARNLSLLQDDAIAEEALTDAIEQTPLFKKLNKDDGKLLNKKIETTLYRWRKRGILNQKTFAIRMAQAVKSALSAVLSQRSKGSKLALKKSAPQGGKGVGRFSNGSANLGRDPSSAGRMSPPQSDLKTPSRTTDDTAFVSDSEGMARHSSREEGDLMDVDMHLAINDFLPNLIEAIGLQVASRTTSSLGMKKLYEMYKLAGPCMPVSDQQALRQDISKEFLKVFDESNRDTRLSGQSECRVFSVKREDPAVLWIQINIGRPFDVRDHTSKKSVLVRRVHNLQGTEPMDLLRTANAIEASDAVGRYAHYASQGTTTDPITDLQRAANENVLFGNNKKPKDNEDRHVSRLSATISQQSKEQTELVAVNEHSVCLDQNASEKKSRKRMRVEEFGENGDCPVRQSIKWDWKGTTDAAAAVWGATSSETNSVPFKCRVTFKGSDVFAGMQALLDAGIMEGPLPHYMRDAPCWEEK